MILKIKKPDFLGDSKWEFVHEHALEAKLQDRTWLESFRSGEVLLIPGSAMRANVQVDVAYGSDREVLSRAYTVLKVLEVIPPPDHQQPRLIQ